MSGLREQNIYTEWTGINKQRRYDGQPRRKAPQAKGCGNSNNAIVRDSKYQKRKEDPKTFFEVFHNDKNGLCPKDKNWWYPLSNRTRPGIQENFRWKQNHLQVNAVVSQEFSVLLQCHGLQLTSWTVFLADLIQVHLKSLVQLCTLDGWHQ